MPKFLFVGTPMFGGMCHGDYMVSMVRLMPVFMKAGMGVQFSYTMNESLVTRARDRLAYEFLQSECTHLMFIDSDIGFAAEDILSMVAADRDIICGVYPKKEIAWQRVAAAVRRGVWPEKLAEHTGVPIVNAFTVGPKGDDQLVEVENAGTGFMLIARAVLENLSDKIPTYRCEGKEFHQFFDTSIDDGVLLSEDFHFCKLAREHGYKVWAAPEVSLSHTGSYQFR